jgi:type VI secretion system secreted protein VgrG
VIVDFLAGNPDRPIIIGRVYNADHGTANQPFPKDRKADPRSVSIPDDYLLNASPPTSSKFTRSGIKTATVKDDTGEVVDNKYHLLRFDDNSTYNQVLVRSQGRLDITAFASRYESIHHDRHLTVGGKKMTPPPPEIAGDYKAHIFRHYHLHVGDPDFPTQSGNRYTLLEQNEELQVKGDLGQLVGGNWSVSVGNPGPSMNGQATIDAGGPMGTIVLNANFNITLSVGANSIVITPLGISITAPTINLVTPLLLSTTPLVPFGAAPLPPSPPIDPSVTPPDPPTAADDGSTTPPAKKD